MCWHLASAKSRGLFHAAIIESGSCDANEFFLPLASQNAFGDAYSAAIGCNSSSVAGNLSASDASFLACLRDKKTEEIMNGVLNWFNPHWPGHSDRSPVPAHDIARGPSLAAFKKVSASKPLSVLSSFGFDSVDILSGLPPLAPVMPWGPVVDGTKVGLTDKPLKVLQRGQGNYVPTIWGSNKNEGSMFVPLVPLVVKGGTFPLNEDTMVATLMHFFKDNQTMVDEVLKLYPLGDFDNSQDVRTASILRDCFFSCGMRRSARVMDDHGAKAWLYHFEFPLRGVAEIVYDVLGNFHASELGFVFGTWVGNDKDSQAMSSAFQRYWGNLAASMDVNIDGHSRVGQDSAASTGVYWPHHNRSSDYNIVMDIPLQKQQGLYADKCKYWDAHA